jgi:hypothetical protein
MESEPTRRTLAVALASLAVLAGCELDLLRSQETHAALDETIADSESIGFTAAAIELGGIFSMGQSAEQSALQLHDLMSSQLGCGGLTLDQATLTVEYATCNFMPNVFGGKHTVHIEEESPSHLRVTHTWDKLTNGNIEINGSALVTWSAQDPVRHVVDEYTWVRLKDGRMGVGGGDRRQAALDGRSVFDGLQVDGTRSWEGEDGHWDLSIQGIEIRWVDPVPYTGLWILRTPKGRNVTFAFDRIDPENIGIDVSSGDFDLALNVDKKGYVSTRLKDE